MSKYDNYVTFINKINKVRSFTIKYKVPILATLFVSFATLVGFLSTKGMIISTSDIPSTIYYGEEAKLNNAKVLFGSPSYEYREKSSSTWSNELPTSPGEYYVRIVSERAFGIKSYSEEKLVEIKPLNVSINIENTSLIYGDTPQFDTSFLVRNDSIEKVVVSFDNPQDDKTIVDIDSLVIKNEDGKDVSSFYSFECESKEVELLSRNVDFIPLLESKVYDGEEIVYEEGKLTKEVQLYDDIVTFDVYYTDISGNRLSEDDTPKNAGKYYIHVDLDSFNAINNGVNVNNKYNIVRSSAEFSIYKRQIKIKTKSDSKIYDGKSFKDTNSENKAFIASDSPYSLVNGDELIINDDDNNYLNEVNANNYINSLSVSIFTKDGENNNKNYEIISYDFGELEIKQKEISGSLTPRENSFEYDGEIITNDSFEYSNILEISTNSLVEGQKLDVNLVFIDLLTQNVIDKPRDAGKYKAIINCYVHDDSGFDYTNNYINNLNEFEFEITPRKVKIQPFVIDDFVYDGISHSYSYDFNNFSMVSSSIIKNDNFTVSISFTNLNRDDISVGYTYSSAGRYEYSIKEIIPSSNTKISNYDFDLGENKYYFTIEQKEFSIELYEIGNIEYNGLPYQYDINYYANEFVNGESASLVLKYYDVTKQVYLESYPINAGKYKVEVEGLNYNGNTDSNNYRINIENAYKEFTITPRYLTLSLNSFDVTYGEKIVFDKKGYEITSESSFANGESVELSISIDEDTTKLDVGEYQLNCFGITYINHLNAHDDALAQNYVITIDNISSYLRINKRRIVIQPKIIETFVYDGNDYSYTDLVSNEFGNFDYASSSPYQMVDNENIKVEVKFYKVTSSSPSDLVRNAGTYTVSIYNSIANENTKLENYSIEVLNTSITIQSRVIKVSPFEVKNKEYDNVYISFGEYDYNVIIENPGDLSVVDGDDLKVEILIYDEYYNYRSEVKNAGSYIAKITSYSINDNEEEKNNYNLIFLDVNFTIFKRSITLRYNDYEKVYDGENYLFNETNYEVVGDKKFAEKDGGVYLSLISYCLANDRKTTLDSIKNAEMYSLNVEAYEGINGVDLNNYNITYDTSTIIEIKKRSVTLQTLDIADFEYDGQEHYYDNYYGNYQVVSETKMVGEEAFILPVSFIYENKSQSYALNAGYYKMVVSSMDDTYINGINGFLYSNYDLTIKFDDFYINERYVEVKIEDITKVYDGRTDNYTYNVETINYTSFPNDEGIIIETVVFNNNPLDVGLYEMEITSYSFKDNTLNINYKIDYSTPGELKIIKRQVTIIPINFENKEYDGEYYHYDNSYAGNYDVTSSTSLVDGEEFIIDAYFIAENDGMKYDKVKDVDNYTLYIDSNSILSGNDKTKVSNYDIYLESVSFVISPLNLKVKPDLSLIQGNNYYDGYVKTYKEKLNNFVIINNKTIPNGEGFTASLGIVSKNGFDTLLHAFEYEIYIDTNKLVPNDITKASNYYIYSDYEFYNIEARKLTIDLISMEETIYDGLAHSYDNGVENNFTLLEGSMVEGETLAIYCTVGNEISVYDVGTYVVNYDYHIVINGIASDYEVTQKRVLIYNIVQRKVNISLYQIEDFIYTGAVEEPYNLGRANQFNYQEGSLELVDNEYLYINKIAYYDASSNLLTTPFNVGSYLYTVYLEDEYVSFVGRSLRNYNITFDTKSFKINKADLNVKLYEDDIVHTYNNEEVTDIYGFTSNILGQDTVSITVKVFNEDNVEEAPINAKTYYIYIDKVIVSCPNNYNIIISDAYRKIIINPCDVYLSAVDKEVTYNGENVDLLNENVNINFYNNSLMYNDDEIIVLSYVYYSDNEGINVISNPKDAGQYYFRIDQVTINNIEHINNYNFIYDEIISSLIINPKSIKFIPLQMETITYDGEYHSYPSYMGNYDYVIGALPGVEFNISIYLNKNNNDKGLIDDVFESEGELEVYRAYTYLYSSIDVNECNGDLISNYTYEIGSDNFHENTFTIEQIRLTVYTCNDKIEYDGSYHLFDQDITSSGTLLSGHELSINHLIDSQKYKFKNVGIYSNNFPVDIIDTNNLDDENRKYVTENYYITYVFGKIEITPIELSITSLDRTKVYDGTIEDSNVLTKEKDYNVIGLISTDEIVVVTDYLAHQEKSSDYIVAGEYTNFVTVQSITDQYGEDVLSNYVINCYYGKYTITALDIEIVFKDINKVFDNESLDYTFSNDSIYKLLGDNGLQNNDMLQGTFTYYLDGEIVNDIRRPGTYTVIISDISIQDSATNEDRTGSYNITYNKLETEIIITKIEVDIKTNSHTWVYDGNSHYDNIAKFVDSTNITFVCKIVCSGAYESVLNVGEEKVNKFDFVIMAGEEDITSCFIINNIIYGTINIGDELSISDLLDSYVYDGYIHNNTQFTVYCNVNNMFAPNLRCEVQVEFKDNKMPYAAGDYYCRIVSYSIQYTDQNGSIIDQTSEYKFQDFSSEENNNYEKYKVQISKRTIYIGLLETIKTKTYDGEILSFASDEWTYVVNKEGNSRKDEFASPDNIHIVVGVVNSYGVVQEYSPNAGAKTYQIIDYEIYGFDGLELELNPDAYGELKNKYLSYDIILRKEDDPEYDRNVHNYTCRGTIYKRNINIKTYGNTDTIVYDGQAHYVNKWEMEENGEDEGLLPNHTMTMIENSYGVTNAGSFLNRIKFSITDDLDNSMNSNYFINYNDWDEGYINIDYRKLTIKTGSKTITKSQLINEYGGELVCYDYELVEGELVEGQVLFTEELYGLFTEEEKYKYRNSIVRFITGSLSYVGSIENSVDDYYLYAYFLSEEGKLTSKRSRNYEFTIIYGTLTVVEDNVTI